MVKYLVPALIVIAGAFSGVIGALLGNLAIFVIGLGAAAYGIGFAAGRDSAHQAR